MGPYWRLPRGLHRSKGVAVDYWFSIKAENLIPVVIIIKRCRRTNQTSRLLRHHSMASYYDHRRSHDFYLGCTQVNSALHPSGVAKSSTSFGWGKGGKVTSAGWQVTLCDLIWHVISRSGVVISITNCYIRFTYLLTHRPIFICRHGVSKMVQPSHKLFSEFFGGPRDLKHAN